MKLEYFSVGPFSFHRRPITAAAPEGQTGFVDNGHDHGWTDREVAVCKDGAWTKPNGKALRFEPTHWTEMLDLKK